MSDQDGTAATLRTRTGRNRLASGPDARVLFPRGRCVTFYLGCHSPVWLSRTASPLFVSWRRFDRCKGSLRARGPWALDSGGYSELGSLGRYRLSPREYSAVVLELVDRVGRPDFACSQDWMCEPAALYATGLSVRIHQRRTVASFLTLCDLAPSVPWIPVLQGWSLADYLRCADMYGRAGVDLSLLPRVGVGSVCRRQSSAEALAIFAGLSGLGASLHGFGLKIGFFSAGGGRFVSSADSMAWSYRARRSLPLPGCDHASCANCLRFALRWGRRVRAMTW